MAQMIEFPSGAERSATILRREPMTMAQVIGKRLKQLREQCGLTKARLSEMARGVSARTISRLENGDGLPHRGTIKRLAKALDVDPGVLTGEKPMPAFVGQPNVTAEGPAYPFYVRVHPAIRNSFELVARRYRVSVPKIAQLAPLLFVILAEASLSQRSNKVDECRAKIEELKRAASDLPYGGIPVIDEDIEWEENAIRKHDVFGRTLPNAARDSWDSDNPFATYLEVLAARYAAGDVTIDAVGPTSADYRVCPSAALALAGGVHDLADSVLNGEVLIHKMLRGLTPEQRIARMRDLEAPVRGTEEEIPDEVPEQLPEYHDTSLAIEL